MATERQPYARRRRGFTLPEIMLALLVMALTVATFAATFPGAGQAISRSKHIDQASDECQKQLDFYRNVSYNSLPAIPAGVSSTSVTFVPSSELPGATGVVTFTHVDNNFNAVTTRTGRVRVDATVTWVGVGSDRGTQSLSTLIVE